MNYYALPSDRGKHRRRGGSTGSRRAPAARPTAAAAASEAASSGLAAAEATSYFPLLGGGRRTHTRAFVMVHNSISRATRLRARKYRRRSSDPRGSLHCTKPPAVPRCLSSIMIHTPLLALHACALEGAAILTGEDAVHFFFRAALFNWQPSRGMF